MAAFGQRAGFGSRSLVERAFVGGVQVHVTGGGVINTVETESVDRSPSADGGPQPPVSSTVPERGSGAPTIKRSNVGVPFLIAVYS
jgi:hypothetical protein